MEDTSLTASKTHTIARRTVVKGAAWSVPVIAAAVAVPMAAASKVAPEINLPLGERITHWKGDHHYGSNNSTSSRRSYDLPIDVKDSSGNPIVGATVTVVASGTNRDGNLLGVYAYPAPDKAPNKVQDTTATATTNASGRAQFAVNTQNVSSGERPATATLTVSVTNDGVTATKTITVYITETD